jgi:hypothetical protein
VSKISELSDGGSLVSSDYLIAVRSGGNVKVRMDQINVDQVDLGDNEFIRLGNSQDLTMVHTSTQSIINQAGIGDLLIQKAGATKLTINATGIDVTGSVTADGLTVDGNAGIGTSSPFFTAAGRTSLSVNGTSSSILAFGKGGSSENYILADAGGLTIANTSATLPTTFFNNASNSMTIDAAGNLLLNTAANAGGYKFRFNGVGAIGDTDSALKLGRLDADTTYLQATSDAGVAKAIAFFGASESMRIDVSKNLLVGKTATAFGTAGVEASASSGLWSTRSGFPALALNRLSTDGSIADFYKDGAVVGSIGTYSGDLWIGQGNTGLLFNDGGDVLRPANASGGNRDGNYDLGASDSRFKDLYLSGSANINGNINNYVPTNSGNPEFSIGSSATNRLFVQSVYNSGAQVLNYTVFRTFTSSSTANAGRIVFSVDEADKLEINDGGIAVTGGVYLGGTGAANLLDDYEEGTFTAALTADTGTITLSNGLMRYTKIGRVVTVSGLIICSAISSPTGDLTLTGLPFTVNNNTDGVYSGLSTGSIHIQALASTITGNPQISLPNNTTTINIDGFNGTTRTSIAANISATTQIRICATYTV